MVRRSSSPRRIDPAPVVKPPAALLRLAPAILLAGFAIGGAALTFLIRPWDSLAWSTWPSGYEAARIARNLSGGIGYASPFLALPGDNFLSDPPDSDNPGLAAPAPQEAKPGAAPTAWVTPPYVLLWLLAFGMFGVYTAAAVTAFQVGQVGLMTAALAIAWRLVARVRGERTGFLALLLLVLYPSSWYFAVGDTHGTALFLVWLMASLFSLERIVAGTGDAARAAGASRGPGTWMAIHGVTVALAILTEPSSLFFFLWLEGWVGFRLLRGRGDAWPGGRLLAVTAAALVLVIGPWFLRNTLALEAPVPLKSNLPMELFYGNNEDSAWDLHQGHVKNFPAWNEDERLRLLAVGEPEYGRQCLTRAAMFLHEHPVSVARLTLQRVTYFWSYNPFRTTTWRPLLTLLFHLPIGVLGVCLLLDRRRDWFDAACLGFLALAPILYYVTHLMIYRYRFPLEAVLLMACAGAWGRLRGWSDPPEERSTVRA
jgi:hypothetical protein